MNFLRIPFLLTAIMASTLTLAADDSLAPMGEAEVRQMFKIQGLDTQASDQIVAALKTGPEATGEKDLQVSTVLFSHGGNMAFFVDNDSWNFDAAVKYDGKVAKVKDLYEVYYYNGGLKSEIVWKWMWIFIPKATTLSDLDGATFGGKVFGRGIALSTSIFSKNPVAIEAGWVSRSGGLGNVFIVAAKVGLGLSGGLSVATTVQARGGRATQFSSKMKIGYPDIMFPKLEFKQKKVL